jgi:DNA-binding MarR family transcriptional regulator
LPDHAPRTPRKAGSSPPSLASRGVVRVGEDFTTEYPDADRSSTELFATLMRTGFVLRAELDRVVTASLGINQAMTNTLAVVEGADEPLTPSEISDRTLISSATMTSTLDRLARQGWIRRLPNPEDRRSVLVEITDEGQQLCDRFLPGIHAVEREVMSELDPLEREQLLLLLGKMLAGAARVTDAEPMPLEGRRRRPK